MLIRNVPASPSPGCGRQSWRAASRLVAKEKGGSLRSHTNTRLMAVHTCPRESRLPGQRHRDCCVGGLRVKTRPRLPRRSTIDAYYDPTDPSQAVRDVSL